MTKLSYKEALARAQNLCSRQEKCIADIEKKLHEWGVSVDVEKIINSLIKENFVNEKRYADAFAKEKFRFNHWGKIKIRYALRQKNINEETITTGLDEIDKDEYAETLKKLILDKYKSTKAKNTYELRGKLQKYVFGKGFENEMVIKIINEIISKNNSSN
ncbi:unnamed protein product [marine sediment metagenome]|uniref:Regulatory protein RecX n=1 Tax=marine sediment metagenome TaxID=412755 RepID=X1UH52_9ZZZZ